MKRPFALAGLAFYTTLVILNFTCQPLFALIFSVLALTGALAFLCLWRLCRMGRAASALAVCVFALMAGLLYTGASLWLCESDAALNGRTLSLSAEIDGDISERTDYLILPLKVESAFDALTGEAVTVRGRLSVTAADTTALRPYDIIQCTVRLSSFDDPKSLRYARAKGVYINARLEGQPEVMQTGRLPAKAVFYRIRNAAGGALDARIGGNAGALIKGIVMGDKEGLPASVTDEFRRSGLSHTMAVSGLHITIFSGALMLVLNALGVSRKPAYALCAVLPFLIAGVAGFTMSALRASVMGGVYFIGKLMDEEADGLNSLGLALFAITLFSPFCACDAGLMLSAAATLGLILFSGRLGDAIGRRLPKKARRLGFVRAAFATVCCSFSAMLFTLPVSALYFGAFSASGMAANLLAWPFIHLAFLSGILTAALYFALPLSAACAAIAEFCAQVIMRIASMLSSTPFSYLYTDRPYILLSLLFAALAGGLSLATSRKKRLVRPVIAASLTVMVFCSGIAGNLLATRDQLTVVAVDVGNGDCIAAIKNRCAVVVDCGGASGASDRLQNVLRAHNVSAVKAVIISHTHRDHAEGVDDILRAFPADAVFLPPTPQTDRYRMDIEAAAQRTGAELIPVENDMTLTLMDGLVIRLYVDYLKKVGLAAGDDNENCLVAGLSYRAFDCLFTGDIGFEQERLLAAYGGLLDVEVLKVAHHGSKNSTGEAFLKQATPLTALVCVGRNSYGHPAAESLERLLAQGAHILRTDQSGNITLRTDGRRHYSISTERGMAS